MQTLLDNIDEYLADIDDDLMLLDQEERPTMRLKRSFTHLRRQVDAAAKREEKANPQGLRYNGFRLG